MFDRLRQALTGRRSGSSFVECRRCGTRVDHEDGTCRCCGSTEIAQYDI
jgi:ribosomal protein L37E